MLKNIFRKTLLLSLLLVVMSLPNIAFAKTSVIISATPEKWGNSSGPGLDVEGEWLKCASPAGLASGTDSGMAVNQSETFPEGCSFIYTTNFKTPVQPHDSAQSVWFRIAVGGNYWVNAFRVKTEPGADITLDFASADETRFSATAFDTSNGKFDLDFDTEYTMKITLKPSGIKKNVKFVAELYNKSGTRLGAGVVNNYSLISTDNLTGLVGLRLVLHRDAATIVQEPACYVGKTMLEVEEPKGDLKPVFFPENGSDNANVNGNFYASFGEEIADVELKDVSISGGASVKSVNLTSENKKLEFEFSNLKPSTKYDVTIKNINVRGSIVFYDYVWSFTTSSQVTYKKGSLETLFDDDLSAVDIINFGTTVVSNSWPTSTDFTEGSVYGGRGSTVNSDSDDEMVRQAENGITFSTAKMKGTKWIGKSYAIRKTFPKTEVDESKGYKMTFDFKTGPKTPVNFDVWYCMNNWKANPFAYNSADCKITFASSNANAWEATKSSDGKTEFALEENTDYSLTMELKKNEKTGLVNALLTLFDSEGNQINSALLENVSGLTNINSMLNFSIQSMVNEDGSTFDSMDYFTLKNIKAEASVSGCGGIVSGDNVIVVPWENLFPEESFTSTFIAVTENESGAIENVNIVKFEDVTGESGEHEIIVNVPESEGRKIKVYVVNDVEGMIPLSEVYLVN